MTVRAKPPTRTQQAVLAELVDAYPSFLTTWEVGNRFTGAITRPEIAHLLTECEHAGWVCSYRSGPGETVGWSLATPHIGDAS